MDTLTCPFCDAADVERVGQWGGQIITAQWRCRACGSYFEAVREDFDEPPAVAAPARIVLHRRIEFADTDASGIYHWTTVFRLAEAAEAALHTALGIEQRTFGAVPRVAVAVDYHQPLRFNDPVTVELAVESVGRASVRYRLEVVGPQGLACSGHLTTCHVSPDMRRPAPWPADIAELLGSGGPQVATQPASSERK